MSEITWTPKMCEACKTQPAVWHHTDHPAVADVVSREHAAMMLCDDCSYGVGGDYTFWAGCTDMSRVEALWLMHCEAPPMTAYEIEKAERWERETRHWGKLTLKWQG